MTAFFIIAPPLIANLSAYDFMMVFLDLLSFTVQPSIPLAITVGIGVSLEQLKKKGILCLSPPKIKLGGSLDIIMFDKARLVDEKQAVLFGFVPVVQGEVQDIGAKPGSPQLDFCVGACHSIVLMPEPIGQLK